MGQHICYQETSNLNVSFSVTISIPFPIRQLLSLYSYFLLHQLVYSFLSYIPLGLNGLLNPQVV